MDTAKQLIDLNGTMLFKGDKVATFIGPVGSGHQVRLIVGTVTDITTDHIGFLLKVSYEVIPRWCASKKPIKRSVPRRVTDVSVVFDAQRAPS